MKRLCALFLLAGTLLLDVPPASATYYDHRGHNLDSLERVVARWTPDAVDRAGEQELLELNSAYRELMMGYNQLNGEKSIFYARKALDLSSRADWSFASADALRYLGQHFWAREQYDSARVYYERAMEQVERMEAGATSPTRPEGYTAAEIDDMRSALYGSMGNLYNEMGDIPRALDYYARAGAIFEQYGWNNSNSILHYNLGETWLDEGDVHAAEEEYRIALDFAVAAGDSLQMARARKGLGRAYLEQGKTWKALRSLHQADEYFAVHDDEEAVSRKENFEYMSLALASQRKMLSWLLAGLVLLLLSGAGLLWLSRRLRRSRAEQAETDAVMEETLEELRQSRPGDVSVTAREQEILELLSKGYTTPQIAEALSLSPETVKWYRKKLLVKFDVANTAELIAKAIEP